MQCVMTRLSKSTLHGMLREPEPSACHVGTDADQCEGQSRVILMASRSNVLTYAVSHHERLSAVGSHRWEPGTIDFAPQCRIPFRSEILTEEGHPFHAFPH